MRAFAEVVGTRIEVCQAMWLVCVCKKDSWWLTEIANLGSLVQQED